MEMSLHLGDFKLPGVSEHRTEGRTQGLLSSKFQPTSKSRGGQLLNVTELVSSITEF